jgi:hypothetical protein
VASTKQCPFCLSSIPAAATKCRNCGEWVDGRERGTTSGEPSDQSLRRFFESDDLDETLNVGIKWYVKYRVVMAIVGFLVFLIFLFTVFLPQWNRVNDGFEGPGGPVPLIENPGP